MTKHITGTRQEWLAARLELRPEFVASRGTLRWRLRRQLSRVKLGRAPAAFGLWVAR